MPDQEQTYEPGTFPGNDGRVVTSDPTHGRIPPEIQWEVERVWRPTSTGQRVALEASLVAARAGRQSEGDAPARERTLEAARALITGQRQADYGTPQESFGRIAAIWSALLGVEVSAGQAALMLAGLKMARLAQSIDHVDSWVDLAGYAALGSEVVS